MSSVHTANVLPALVLKETHGPLLGLVCNCTQSHQQAGKVALSSVNYLRGVITCLLGGFVVTCTEHCTTPGLLSEAHNSILNHPSTSLPFFFQLCLLVSVHLNLPVVFPNNCPQLSNYRGKGKCPRFIYLFSMWQHNTHHTSHLFQNCFVSVLSMTCHCAWETRWLKTNEKSVTIIHAQLKWSWLWAVGGEEGKSENFALWNMLYEYNLLGFVCAVACAKLLGGQSQRQ